ncbi:flagellar protein FliS [Jatrophihabitans sp. GAS493]|uniref:flagellar export chaperone FliS n=1 Tax=Jatrophihabitans sp. GAS493 TaxID=1907575 RepID=UPI000BC08E00|nr:flagellar export chaperone FliS [Jatrophihabitans sp. GAS493]SOD71345.1 flagellar protein FliS [Jatrophihabitans sp. GAS493]
MASDDARARYLSDRVLTASPAQRVVMLYDRLGLDITRARAAHEADDATLAATHVSHAVQIVAELRSSLNITTWKGAQDLASLYSYLLVKLLDAGRPEGAELLPHLATIVLDLRTAWGQAADDLSDERTHAAGGHLAGRVA